MSYHLPLEFLRHILQEIDYLLRIGTTTSRMEFDGEAVKHVPTEFRLEHPDVDWRAMTGMRDKLIHDYMGIDHDIVWNVIINKIPQLKSQIKLILGVEPSEER